MKIGIFDSGLGGLYILRSLKRSRLGALDYIYLGDTKNLPYGSKSQKQIYDLTAKAVEYLFRQNCALVIVACNTASSKALRKIQQEWLPKSKYSDRRVLGIIRPTVEAVRKSDSLGIIGTSRTIDSSAYAKELAKIGWKGTLKSKATPRLVPMIESGKIDRQLLEKYLFGFKNSDILILACTHYGLIKSDIATILGKGVRVLSQETLLPSSLAGYLKRHPKIYNSLAKNGKIDLTVTKLSPHSEDLARLWFGLSKLRLVNI